jgi:hypothetical protein
MRVYATVYIRLSNGVIAEPFQFGPRRYQNPAASNPSRSVSNEQKGPRLPKHAASDLDNSCTAGVSLRQAVGDDAGSGSTIKRQAGIARVEDVEDVDGIATDLELRSLIDGDVTEDRCIHISHARPVQSVDSQRAIKIAGAGSCASGCSRRTKSSRIEPLVWRGTPGSYSGLRELACRQVRSVIHIAIPVVVRSRDDCER